MRSSNVASFTLFTKIGLWKLSAWHLKPLGSKFKIQLIQTWVAWALMTVQFVVPTPSFSSVKFAQRIKFAIDSQCENSTSLRPSWRKSIDSLTHVVTRDRVYICISMVGTGRTFCEWEGWIRELKMFFETISRDCCSGTVRIFSNLCPNGLELWINLKILNSCHSILFR